MSIKAGLSDTVVVSGDSAVVRSQDLARAEHLQRIGHFRIQRRLGEGGMGTVYLAHDEAADRQVALKIPSSTVNAEVNAVKRLHREAQAGCAIDHPNVCQVYEVGEHDGCNYLAMQYVAGCTLAEWLQNSPEISTDCAVGMVAKIAGGVQAAHEAGILHRDLKPGNVMINAAGEPIVTDFGMARWMEATQTMLTVSGSLIGTPGYMAPEQIMGEIDQIGPATDVYSLGVILYELLTGWQPFSGNVATLLGSIVSDPPTPLATHIPEIDPRLEAICLKALAKSPEGRYRSAGEFAMALEAFRTGVPGASGDDSQPCNDDKAVAGDAAEPSGRLRKLLKGVFARKA